MGVTVLVLGRSGSGKSTGLRNFEPGEIGVFNVLGKPLPFRKRLQTVDRPGYDLIERTLAANRLRAYAVDDSTYLMQNDNFSRAGEKGYDKFTDMAVSFKKLLDAALETDRDTVVYFLHHCDTNDLGEERVKTVGRMLDQQYCVEGAFPVVLDARVADGRHVFVAQNDGRNLAKAPVGMFPEPVMDNDLKAVDAAIREYWGLAPLTRGRAEGGEL